VIFVVTEKKLKPRDEISTSNIKN